MRHLFCSAVLAVSMLGGSNAALAQEPIKLRVAGNLLATGLILEKKEQPFFVDFEKNSGLPVQVDYKPMDSLGIKDVEGLRTLRTGLFDIVSLRLNQVARDEPFFLGLDLVGLNPDYKTTRAVVDAYRSEFDKRLQKRFNGKLLAIWPFGPQVLFCKSEITGLKDIQNKKVRVYDQSLAKFIENIGGIPVTLAFGEVQQALQRGLVDCAITGPSSANSAGWPEVSNYFMPIGFSVGMQAYGMNLKTWNKFDDKQKAKLTEMFDSYEKELFRYSEELFDDAVRCNVGKQPCTTVRPYQMKEVAVSDADQQVIREAMSKISLPEWSEVCEKTYAGCADIWKSTIGPVVGIQ